MVHGDGKFFGGKLTPVTVMFKVTNIEENTRQKIHRHMENHTIHYTQRHTQSHGHKPTLLTIVQLPPGTTVISHIAVLIHYFLSLGPLYSLPAGIWNQFGLYTKTGEKSPNFLIYKVFLPKWMILQYIPLSHSERATCKYRREDTMRIRSHRCTLFGSFSDSSWWGTVVEFSNIRTHILRMKGKIFAWRMELLRSFGLEIAEFFS